jgi:hypothetical protein
MVEESNTSVSVEANYSPYPKFGHYEELIRLERA